MTMTPAVAACGLCDHCGFVTVWEEGDVRRLRRCPHDPVALERQCQALGYTRAPP